MFFKLYLHLKGHAQPLPDLCRPALGIGEVAQVSLPDPAVQFRKIMRDAAQLRFQNRDRLGQALGFGSFLLFCHVALVCLIQVGPPPTSETKKRPSGGLPKGRSPISSSMS